MFTGYAAKYAITGQGHGAPEEGVQQAGVHGAGDQPHDEVVHDLHGEDGDGVRGEHETQGPTHADAGAQQGQGGQGIAEHEGQGDGHGGAGDVAPPEHGGQDQAEDLADGAAGEAVEGGAGGHVGHVVAGVVGDGVVVHVVIRVGVGVVGRVGGGGRVHATEYIPQGGIQPGAGYDLQAGSSGTGQRSHCWSSQ